MTSHGFNMVNGFRPFHNVGKATKQAGHMVPTIPPFSSTRISCFLSWGKYHALNLRRGKLKGLGKSMRTSNASEGEASLDTKCVGSTRLLICMWRIMF